jgi:hypothetical protein
MKVLIACEESQAVCIEFRKRGHEAFSCDILPCSGGHPEWHIQDDVLKHLNDGWDMMIAFPPCTHLAVSGARWFPEKRDNGSQEKAIIFFMEFFHARINKIAIENPIGIISGNYTKKWFPKLSWVYGLPYKPAQIIQPWQFGHGETKATCLWLIGLLPLLPTQITQERNNSIWRMPPSPERAKLRSKTFQGIAKAMAEQWG